MRLQAAPSRSRARTNERNELPLARAGAYLFFARNFLTPATPSAPPPTPTSSHDGKNSTLPPPTGCTHSPSGWVIGRNAARAADPAFNVVGVSQPTGLHYSWTWNVSQTCAIHFVHLNLFPGHACGSAANPGGEGSPPPGFPCSNGDLAWAENSLGFLEADLAAHAGPGVMTVTLQHYGFDGFSNSWYNADQRVELLAAINKYNPLLVLVGHTHTAQVVSPRARPSQRAPPKKTFAFTVTPEP